MITGTVSVDDAGAATGSGMALALYNAIVSIQVAANPLPDPSNPPLDWDDTAEDWRKTTLGIVVKTKRAWAREAQQHANVLGVRTLRELTGNGPHALTLDDDLIAVGTRSAGPVVLNLPAGAPIGWQVEIFDVAAQGAAFNVAPVQPGGENIVGIALTTNYQRLFVSKFRADFWAST